jgi:hypothetical protein
MQLHQRRNVDESRVTWLGPNEYIDVWHRPQKAKWMGRTERGQTRILR